jgi:hypothetical protein
MLFWHEQVERLTQQLQSVVIRIDDPESRTEAFGILKTMLAARENSQRCAVDLAPFVHQKLAALAVTHKDEERPPAFTIDVGETVELEDRSYRDAPPAAATTNGSGADQVQEAVALP